MSGLLFLTSDDFVVQKGVNGDVLCNTIPGFSLILFYSTHCVHCKTLVPIFKQLPGTIGGVQFGMINVSVNKNCVKMSKDTIAPISYVPYIILYIGGKPFMKYNGPSDIEEIKRFVLEVAKKVKAKQKFSSDNVKEDPKGGIPLYTIGKPLYGDDDKVCYLNWDDAYTPDTKNEQGR
jgi:thiol-disulfide isomerase/thioredoxin